MVVPVRTSNLKRRRKTLVRGKVRISCTGQAQAKSARDYYHGLSDPYFLLGRIPCRYAVLRTIVFFSYLPQSGEQNSSISLKDPKKIRYVPIVAWAEVSQFSNIMEIWILFGYKSESAKQRANPLKTQLVKVQTIMHTLMFSKIWILHGQTEY